MKFRPFGKAELQVSEVGFGAWAIGGSSYGPTEDRVSIQALKKALDLGVNFFDTADVYGNGHSEELIGKTFRGIRKQVFLATKGGWDFYHSKERVKDLSGSYLKEALHESLKRLDTEYVDLYQLHNPDLETIREGKIFKTLEQFKKEGKSRFVGISVHEVEEANEVILSGRADVVQLVYNMIEQEMRPEILPLAKEKGVAVVAREPLACGFLTGKYTKDSVFGEKDHRKRWTEEELEEDLAAVEKVKFMAARYKIPLAQVALKFVLSREEISVVIPGAKTPEQVEENVRSIEDGYLNSEDLDELYQIFEREFAEKNN
ncbi:MAG: aldo/keto reductase [Candidatus Omnitrophica bacterium]|nr:aldo/keto reductase [Candidatus Omnitrophota bacterium]